MRIGRLGAGTKPFAGPALSQGRSTHTRILLRAETATCTQYPRQSLQEWADKQISLRARNSGVPAGSGAGCKRFHAFSSSGILKSGIGLIALEQLQRALMAPGKLLRMAIRAEQTLRTNSYARMSNLLGLHGLAPVHAEIT